MSEETDEIYQQAVKKSAEINQAEYGTTYECCGEKIKTARDLTDHLREQHGVDVATQKFNRSMLMHMDGRDWFASSYSWACDAVTFTEYSKSKRNKNDPMRYA